MDLPGSRDVERLCSRKRPMNDFNRKVEDASARINQKVTEAAAQVEKEVAEVVDYLNREVVPNVRQHSTRALRAASERLAKLAEYLEQYPTPKK
jgi:glutamyl-tRNA reductase